MFDSFFFKTEPFQRATLKIENDVHSGIIFSYIT
jgi:hypothetical protein